MNILNAKYEILTPISEGGIEELQHIELIARKCYKTEDKITEDGESAKKLIRDTILARGHEAMIEHSHLAVLFYVDRGVSHELVRHRIASFAQESTRYCNYGKSGEINIIDIKPAIHSDAKCSKLESHLQILLFEEWLDAMEDAEKHYLKMIEIGASPQIARSVLPNSTKTEIVMSANYREWRAFFKLRTEDVAHPQMREVTRPLLTELKSKIPVIFDDITYPGESEEN